MTALAGWENFYVIVGSSAGALIGLQFVVVTLIADMPITSDIERASSAFATPTIVHFGAALLLAAVLSAPWTGIAGAAAAWGILGLAGLLYMALVLRRVRRQEAYSPEFEDWLFHLLLPFAAYISLAVPRTSPLGMPGQPCSQSPVRRCCCSSSAFITPGTRSPTT